MYSPVGIEQLSDSQIRKLLKGERIRIKSGGALNVQMVSEHAKKLKSAAKKGAGMMIQLDPYACDLNRESLEGSGVGKKIKSGFKKMGQFVKGHKEEFRPIASALKQAGRDKIAEATMAALDAGVDPSLVASYSQLAQDIIPSGQGIGKKAAKFFRSPAIKTVRKALRPLAQQAFEDAQEVAFQTLDQATQQALSGQGIGNQLLGRGIGKKAAKFFRSPAIKTVRKAFRPLAQQAFEDAQEVAFANLEQATQQALSGGGPTTPRPAWVSSRPAPPLGKPQSPEQKQALAERARSMKSHGGPGPKGGALYPAGGALLPAGYYGGSLSSWDRRVSKAFQ